MVEPEEWRGEWWIASEPETVRPGVLRRDEEDRFRLELVGGFDIEVREPLPGGGWAVMAETREVEMIHGIGEGTRYTLLFPQAVHTTGGLLTENIIKQDWSSNRVLRGIHLVSPDEAVFTRAHLRLDYLLHWSNRTTLTLSIPMHDGEKAGPLEVQRQADGVAVAAQYEEMQLGLRVRSHEFNVERHPIAGTTTVQTTERAVLDLDPPQPMPHDAFDTVYKDLQDLLTFCAYAPAAAQSRSLIYTASGAHPGHAEFPSEVRVMGPQIYRAKWPTANEDARHNYLDAEQQRKALDHPKISWAQAQLRKILSRSSPD